MTLQEVFEARKWAMTGESRSLGSVLSLLVPHCVRSAMRQVTLFYFVTISAVIFFYLTTKGHIKQPTDGNLGKSPNRGLLFKVVLPSILSW